LGALGLLGALSPNALCLLLNALRLLSAQSGLCL